MKKALIISPYFPPYNTPDLQRLRMSLPYYAEFNWEVEVVTVKNPDEDTNIDPHLIESIPTNLTVHYIDCFSKKITQKVGLGSIALRALFFYFKNINTLLETKKYDLIFFTTSQFPLCILGSYWKKKYNIPFIIDLQDPWHTDYHLKRSKKLRPKKYWISYYLNKFLEPIAMNNVDGLISVSEEYIKDLKKKYLNINNIPSTVITFAYSDIDLKLSKSIKVNANKEKSLLSYIGVLGPMMSQSLSIFFKAVSKIENFSSKYYISFKGTSYKNPLIAEKTAVPIALKFGIENIEEKPERLSVFEMLNSLSNSDGLVLFGTDEEGYTSSKLYPYIQSERPILGIFHPKSSAINILKEVTNAFIISLDDSDDQIDLKVEGFLDQVHSKKYFINKELFKHYSALSMTERQCLFFDKVLNSR